MVTLEDLGYTSFFHLVSKGTSTFNAAPQSDIDTKSTKCRSLVSSCVELSVKEKKYYEKFINKYDQI